MYDQIVELLRSNPRIVFTDKQLAQHFDATRLQIARAIRQLPTGCYREPSGLDKVRVSFAVELRASK